MRSQKIDAGGDEKQGILFTWPNGYNIISLTNEHYYYLRVGIWVCTLLFKHLIILNAAAAVFLAAYGTVKFVNPQHTSTVSCVSLCLLLCTGTDPGILKWGGGGGGGGGGELDWSSLKYLGQPLSTCIHPWTDINTVTIDTIDHV